MQSQQKKQPNKQDKKQKNGNIQPKSVESPQNQDTTEEEDINNLLDQSAELLNINPYKGCGCWADE